MLQLQSMQSTEPGVIQFKVETLHFRLALNPTSFQALQLKVAPNQGSEGSWETDDIVALEKFFDTKVRNTVNQLYLATIIFIYLLSYKRGLSLYKVI